MTSLGDFGAMIPYGFLLKHGEVSGKCSHDAEMNANGKETAKKGELEMILPFDGVQRF